MESKEAHIECMTIDCIVTLGRVRRRRSGARTHQVKRALGVSCVESEYGL
jgi:hypothetical protein